MHAIPNNAPSNVAALDEQDPNAGGAWHDSHPRPEPPWGPHETEPAKS